MLIHMPHDRLPCRPPSPVQHRPQGLTPVGLACACSGRVWLVGARLVGRLFRVVLLVGPNLAGTFPR